MSEEMKGFRIDGPILEDDEQGFWGGGFSPKMLAEALEGAGDVTIHINSPGGNVVAASRMYTLLKEHTGDVTIVVDGLAASAASVIAMAGDTVLMSPVAYMMIHCAASIAMGDKHDMAHEADVLEEVDKGIRTAYKLRTGLSDRKLSEMMDEETWMSAATAVSLGFADGILGAEEPEEDEDPEEEPEEKPEYDGIDPDDAKIAPIATRMRRNLRGLPAVAYGARAERNRLLAKMLETGVQDGLKDQPDEKTVAAAADEAKADAIQRLKLRLLSY